ncbi:MAG: hypothetical protein Q8N99_02065 [Nanoarchaeota archaeon]|nr:hypothetical protein [Nanoarchaeota archaeon]
MKDTGEYAGLKKKYGSFLKRLEKVGDEMSHDSKTLSKKLLLELIDKDKPDIRNKLEIIDIIFYSRLHYYYRT